VKFPKEFKLSGWKPARRTGVTGQRIHIGFCCAFINFNPSNNLYFRKYAFKCQLVLMHLIDNPIWVIRLFKDVYWI